jgi:hypothetical protein
MYVLNIYIYIHTYIHTYIQRDRERERWWGWWWWGVMNGGRYGESGEGGRERERKGERELG